MCKVAVTQVQQQLFNGIKNLYPGMIPGIGLVESFQICAMLCYLLRMMEWEGEFMSLHGEDAAQAMRRCLQVCREVGRVSHQTDITNLVLLWHDGHRVV